jgi:hypothetical protein
MVQGCECSQKLATLGSIEPPLLVPLLWLHMRCRMLLLLLLLQ